MGSGVCQILVRAQDTARGASKKLTWPAVEFLGDKQVFLADLQSALYASKIVSYAQGFMLLSSGAVEYGWNLDFRGIALMWRGG